MFRLHHPNYEIDTAIQRGVRWFFEEEVPFIIRSFRDGDGALEYDVHDHERSLRFFENMNLFPEGMNLIDKRTAVTFIDMSNNEIYRNIAEIFDKESVPHEDGTYTFEDKGRYDQWGNDQWGYICSSKTGG